MGFNELFSSPYSTILVSFCSCLSAYVNNFKAKDKLKEKLCARRTHESYEVELCSMILCCAMCLILLCMGNPRPAITLRDR